MLILGLVTLVLHGVLAGLYYAFSMSVMPGLKAVDDDAADAAMRSVNRKILTPWLFVPFLGAPVAAGAAGFLASGAAATWYFAAAAVNLVGSVLITAVVNVPLNNALLGGRIGFREYAPRWTAFNTLRAALCVVSLLLVGVALTR
ncbi:anthrone oxygenase family protein [Rhodococcus sp. NPDC058505]|uniref:anthrone oxygenase family protein n=1 Tax=unclassified Rhodococcus (in: high G+C Gram-positive bacteria) TaxID=192944 RepID=UPI0036497BCC